MSPPDSQPPQFDLDALVDHLAERLANRLFHPQLPRFLSVATAAEYMSISADSVRALLSSGRLTALRPVKGRIAIDRIEIDSYMRSATSRPRRGRGIRPRKGGAG